MHEMSMVQGVLEIAQRYGQKAAARRITAIRIKMGPYNDVVPEIFREYFAIAARDTLADGAQILFQTTPVTLRCRSCGWSGEVKPRQIRCGGCGGVDIQMLSGAEFLVDSLEAE